MNPQWITAGLTLLQLAGAGLIWRVQRDQARELATLKDWIHREYMPRELADALYVRKPDSAQFSAISQPIRAKS